MKKKTQKIHRIICEKNKDFRSYKIKVTPSFLDAIRPIRIENAKRYFDRYEDRQRHLHNDHCVPMHFDGCRAVIKNLHRVKRYKTTYLNSMTLDFVDDMSIFQKNKKQENKQKLQRIMDALSKLSKNQQRRFLLRYYRGYSIQEIATLENVNCTSIRRSIRAAKAHIMNKAK